MAVEMRTTVCEIFLNGWRSSQTVLRTQKCVHPHTFLRIRSGTSYESGSNSRKHSIYTHFPNDRNCDVCLRTKITNSSCTRRTGGAVPRAQKFGDLKTADHKVLSEGCESRKIIDTLLWCKTWPPNGSSRICANQRLPRRRKRVHESFSSRRKNRKLFVRTIHWNLANLVKIRESSNFNTLSIRDK